MIQVVIISNSTTSALSVAAGVEQVKKTVERRANEWLESHPNVEILSISTTPQLAANFWGSGFAMTVTIAYREPQI